MGIALLFDLLGLLIWIFRPFTHNVNIDTVRLKSTILLLASYLFHLFSVPLSSFPGLFWINWIFLQFYFIFFVNLLACKPLFYVSGCFSVYIKYLLQITVYLQVILYHFKYDARTLQKFTSISHIHTFLLSLSYILFHML